MKIPVCVALLLLGSFFAAGARESVEGARWFTVSHTATPYFLYTPERVSVTAEQAVLPTRDLAPRDWIADGGPKNLHTRSLQFVRRGVTYRVPDTFVEDLLRLHLTPGGPTSPFALRSSVKGQDVIFTLLGADGEKGYTAHFHFRNGRFFQRILTYREEQTILIRTNDEQSGRSNVPKR